MRVYLYVANYISVWLLGQVNIFL